MKIMAVNTGSSSFKFSLFEMDTNKVLIRGIFDRIGMEGGSYTFDYKEEKVTQEVVIKDFDDAVNLLLDKLMSLEVISSLEEIKGIGHRINQGGEKYKEAVLINDEVLQEILKLNDLAPIYNPKEVAMIVAFQKVLPNTPMVAVFDTSFHQTMEEERYLYPVPYEWYQNYGVRKYGAYGINHNYVTEKISDYLKNDHLKIVSCHLGKETSITAIKDKKCVDTSIGFTHFSGAMMASSAGDIDTSIIPYMMEKEKRDVNEVIDILNKESGLLGISGLSSDIGDLIESLSSKNERSYLALQKYISSIVKYISEYYVTLGGIDVMVFTASVGEEVPWIRQEIMERLLPLGVVPDLDQNKNTLSTFGKISSPSSKIEVWVVPSEEELMIALETMKII